MPPQGAVASQVQVQGWAVGGERAQGPEDGRGRGREDAFRPMTLTHELCQRVMLSVKTQRKHVCFPNLLLVRDNPLDLSVSTFHAHKMEILNLRRLIAWI